MLKLRKNKKGFTLVELIVVIAIMAVLAGTVAGVTVSQLNKQTDKTNYTQANKIATTISGLVLEDAGTYIIPQGTGNPASTADAFDTTKLAGLITELTGEFSGKNISDIATPAKGEFGVYISQDKSFIVVCFGAKTSNYKNKGYKITTNGVVQEITGESGNTLPAKFTAGGTQTNP